MSHWARFRTARGEVGFGSLSAGRIVEHEGDMFDAPRPTGRSYAIATQVAGNSQGSGVSRDDAISQNSDPNHAGLNDAVTLLSPCVPGKIVALWNNFHALAEKLGKSAPPHPLFFIKSGTSVIGPDEPIRRPSSYAGKIVFEGELGIVIGTHCTDVPVDRAAQAIFGYTCVNDVTAIDILFENPDFPQWGRSKSFDTFGCLGPVIATGIEGSARLTTRLDGVERQNYALADMIFPPHVLVSLISHDVSLCPGDVIACGTSLGVGSIKDGAGVEISIEGIGTLRNVLAPRS